MRTVEKLYNENNQMKKEIEQKKNTIELLNDFLSFGPECPGPIYLSITLNYYSTTQECY